MGLSRRAFVRNLSVGAAVGRLHGPTLSSGWGAFPDIAAGNADSPILLNANENAYGPSQKVRGAISARLSRTNRYPDAEYDTLAEKIAATNAVKPEQVVLGSGSSEILRAAACAFLGPGKLLVQASPTFEAMELYARATGAGVVSLPLERELAHDLDAMSRRESESGSLVYVCNPNNPTGTITPRKRLETFLAKLSKKSYVLIDEAYHPYVIPSTSYRSFIDYPETDERVIVSRTFSNAYGLAGLRIGYGIAHPTTARRMRTYLTVSNINTIAIAAAATALDDEEGLRLAVERNHNERQEFLNQAISRMLRPVDSQANFMFMDVHAPAEDVSRYYRRQHILVGRRYPKPFDTYLRISLGSRSDMQAFWHVWDSMPHGNMSM